MRLVLLIGACLIALEGEAIGEDVRVDANMCGLHSLSIAVSAIGTRDIRKLREELPASSAPFSLAELHRAAKSIGVHGLVVHWNRKEDATFSVPAVLHVRTSEGSAPNHFVACLGERDGNVCIVDFPGNPTFVSRKSLIERWDGNALYLSKRRLVVWWAALSGLASRLVAGCSIALAFMVMYLFPVLGRKVTRLQRLCVFFGMLFIIVLASERSRRIQGRDSQSGRDAAGLNELVASVPVVTITEPREEGGGIDIKEVTLTLENVGHRSVTIEDVETTCRCVVSQNVNGARIVPGGKLTIPVRVSMSQFSGGVQMLYVHHNGAGESVKFEIHYDASTAIPLFDRNSRGSVAFFKLADKRETREFEFDTVERRESQRWIRDVRVECENMFARIVTVDTQPLEGNSVVSRRYRVQVGWNELPNDAEVRTRVIAETSFGTQDPVVGFVIARVACHGVSPSAIVVSETPKTVSVLCPKDDGQDDWQVVGAKSLPAWVQTRWKRSPSNDILLVSVENHRHDSSVEAIVSLENGFGMQVNVPIIVLP